MATNMCGLPCSVPSSALSIWGLFAYRTHINCPAGLLEGHGRIHRGVTALHCRRARTEGVRVLALAIDADQYPSRDPRSQWCANNEKIAWEAAMDWPIFRHVERRAIRMHQMMTRLGVDVAQFARKRHGDAYTEARMRCLNCGTAEKCLRWLDGCSRQDRLPEFCPNLRDFETCMNTPKRAVRPGESGKKMSGDGYKGATGTPPSHRAND